MGSPHRSIGDAWPRECPGRAPWPTALAFILVPLLALWTLPQTVAGLVYAASKRARGHRLMAYRFGPFVFLVVPSPPYGAAGICLGPVVLARDASLLTHEFCHAYPGLWLGWLYLPVYGLEYLLFGHDGSPHERLTVHLERSNRAAWRRLR